MTEHATQLLLWGWVAHLVADFVLQNEWQALNKGSLKHPAAWVHSTIQGLCALFVFPWPAALALGLVHLAVDTRKPLDWWRRLVKQTRTGPIMLPFGLIQDQSVHVICLAVAAVLCGGAF